MSVILSSNAGSQSCMTATGQLSNCLTETVTSQQRCKYGVTPLQTSSKMTQPCKGLEVNDASKQELHKQEMQGYCSCNKHSMSRGYQHDMHMSCYMMSQVLPYSLRRQSWCWEAGIACKRLHCLQFAESISASSELQLYSTVFCWHNACGCPARHLPTAYYWSSQVKGSCKEWRCKRMDPNKSSTVTNTGCPVVT